MKNILVLGAGLVAGPLVRYLMDTPGIEVTLAARDGKKADAMVAGHPSGRTAVLDMEDGEALGRMIEASDLVVSLLPWTFHPQVARCCLDLGKHMLTASYVKEEMQALDEAARKKGLIFMNEIGVDPGLDHMAAMKTIHEIQGSGGTVTSFYSYCGGLPAMADNTNPLGYKFSWSPEGALLAAGNDGRYLKDGKIVEIPGDRLFEHYWLLEVPGACVTEAYVNRDALPYKAVYGISEATDIYRGTLRYMGHCEAWTHFKRLGLLDQDAFFDTNALSPARIMARIIGSNGQDLQGDLCRFLGVEPFSTTLKKLEWLGLLEDHPLDAGEMSLFQMFAQILKEKLAFAPGEADLLLQHHEFIGAYPDGRREKLFSTLVTTGEPDGETAMARTVGLPAAIAARLIVEEKIPTRGVCIPVLPEIYLPILAELETLGISFVEKKVRLDV